MSSLIEASRDGDTKLVKQLLDGDTPIDEKDAKGRTALMVASEYGKTEVVKLLLDKGALLYEKEMYGNTALMLASLKGHTKVVKLLLDRGASVDEKAEIGRTALMWASDRGHTGVVKLLLDKGALVDVKAKDGNTALMMASERGYTEVVKLLLDKGASVDEKDKRGWTALMWASRYGHTEVVKLLLDEGASVDEKDEDGRTVLMVASMRGLTEVVQLLLEKGASVDEKNKHGWTALMEANYGSNKHGWTALMMASEKGYTEVVKLLLDIGALFDAVHARHDAALLVLTGVDEDHLGRMAAAQAHRHLPQRSESDAPASEVLVATATAVFNLVRLAGSAAARARKLRSSDPRSADDHQALFGRLQLAAAACVQNEVSGKDRDEKDVQKLFRSDDGRKALEHAVQIEAKELLAQPVVQKYIIIAWRGKLLDELVEEGFPFACILVSLLVSLLLQLLFLLPLVALVPALDPCLNNKLYLLRLPVVKFGLACAADLALALALTIIPATDLATAPVAPLLLVWVGSGLLWEGRELMAPSSSDATSRPARAYDRLAAYWGDSINRVDATALIFSAAALVAFMSAGDIEDATATSLHAVAVFLLWLRVIRVLLVSPQFGPFVLMFFRMLCNDVIYFLVLLLFLLVAFAASWTVLLAPQSSIAGCADELGGVDFHTTLLRIFEGALTGSDYFECARNSTSSPVAAWGVTAVYVTLTAVLLLNMLIAMMAKTFDNISEASATNYLFLFAQRTLAHQNEPPTPPPLNIEAKKIAPLAKKITEYILDHQDDAAQDRWRTTMKRNMVKSFRAQHKESDTQREVMDSRFDRQREEVQAVKAEVKAEVQKVEAELQRQRDAIHEVHTKLDTKLDETIQLVRNLTNP